MKSYFSRLAARSVGAQQGQNARHISPHPTHRAEHASSDPVADPFELSVSNATPASWTTATVAPNAYPSNDNAVQFDAHHALSTPTISSLRENPDSVGGSTSEFIPEPSQSMLAPASTRPVATIPRIEKQNTHVTFASEESAVSSKYLSATPPKEDGKRSFDDAPLAQADAFMSRFVRQRSSAPQPEPMAVVIGKQQSTRQNNNPRQSLADGIDSNVERVPRSSDLSTPTRTRLAPKQTVEATAQPRSVSQRSAGSSLVIGNVTVEVAAPPAPVSRQRERTIIVRQGQKPSSSVPSSRTFGLSQF